MTAVIVVGEDELCCAIADAMIAHSGVETGVQNRIVAGGAGPFRARIRPMNEVAMNVMPVLMIADADQATCAVTQRNTWLPANADRRLCMRLAVREAEAWVLADHEGFSDFANVSRALFPAQPETLDDPKRALLSIIKKCKRRELRDEMLPARGATSPVGLGYNVHMTAFVRNRWSIDRALERAPSLARAIPRVAALLSDE